MIYPPTIPDFYELGIVGSLDIVNYRDLGKDVIMISNASTSSSK
jgi:hypothetical protein